MTPEMLLLQVIRPVLALLGEKFCGLKAEILMLAIAMQESGDLRHTAQIGGPARGYWQFELGTRISRGGLYGVFLHQATAALFAQGCARFGCAPNPEAAYSALATNHPLAAWMARLLLWSNASPLPVNLTPDSAWAYYISTWRPGRPHPEFWPRRYGIALKAVTGAVG